MASPTGACIIPQARPFVQAKPARNRDHPCRSKPLLTPGRKSPESRHSWPHEANSPIDTSRGRRSFATNGRADRAPDRQQIHTLSQRTRDGMEAGAHVAICTINRRRQLAARSSTTPTSRRVTTFAPARYRAIRAPAGRATCSWPLPAESSTATTSSPTPSLAAPARSLPSGRSTWPCPRAWWTIRAKPWAASASTWPATPASSCA